jgi:hypothetical protein
MAERDWESRYQQARRAATGTNVLGVVMLGFLGGYGYWWYGIWASVFVPVLFSPQWTITILIAIVYTIVLPLFISMVFPNSPAGRLLQKQTWAVPGQILVAVTACLLAGVAIRVFAVWLTVQPGVVETGMFYPALLAMITGAIVLPAITWTMTTPEKLIALYRQARIARQLDQQAQLEDLKFKALHARFVAIANSDMRKLTLEKFGAYCEEMTAILATGAREEQRRYRSLADTFAVIHNFELSTSDPEEVDQEILSQYRDVNRLLTGTADSVIEVADYAESLSLREVNPAHVDSRLEPSIPRAAPREAAHVAAAAHVDSRLEPSIPRVAAGTTRHQVAPYGIEYARAAWDSFKRRPWTVKQLAGALQVSETAAKDLKDHWLRDAIIREANLGRWCFTYESEAAQ